MTKFGTIGLVILILDIIHQLHCYYVVTISRIGVYSGSVLKSAETRASTLKHLVDIVSPSDEL